MQFEEALRCFVAHYAEDWPDAAAAHRSEGDGFRKLTVSSPSQLRSHEGNYAQILHHGQVTDNVIVLIHGLTDSPFYMSVIAADFARLGFNVVLPLLPGHALNRPGRVFRRLKHTDWIKEVDTACAIAQSLGDQVSIGGLSTGGALSVHKAIRSPQCITGGLFLYSAALDIGTVEQLLLQTEAGRMIARLSDQAIWLEKTVTEQIKMILDDQKAGESNENYGIGDNPYKYSVFFYEGASQLAEVIQEINEHYNDEIPKFSDVNQPVFVAHSKTDDSALFRGIEPLVDNHPNPAATLFALEDVPHPSVVLKQAIIDDVDHEEYAPANPYYAEMSEAMLSFARKHLSTPSCANPSSSF